MLEPQLGMSMRQLVDTAKLAEELGFGYLFRSDHLLPTDGRRGVDSPECWTSLGAISAATTDLNFGPMVSPVGFRNPALLARMACTLHSYSGGRLQLAVGAGWYEDEYRAHGYPFPGFKDRLGQFREALQIMVPLIRDGRVDYDGKYFSAHTDCLPRPAGRLHLIFGARAKSMVRLAAGIADEWNFFHTPLSEYRRLRAVLDQESQGRKVDVSEMGPYMIGRSRSELESAAKLQASKLGQALSPSDLLMRLKAREAPCGTVEEFVDQLRQRIDAGVSKLYFQTLVPENRQMVELLADTLKSGV